VQRHPRGPASSTAARAVLPSRCHCSPEACSHACMCIRIAMRMQITVPCPPSPSPLDRHTQAHRLQVQCATEPGRSSRSRAGQESVCGRARARDEPRCARAGACLMAKGWHTGDRTHSQPASQPASQPGHRWWEWECGSCASLHQPRLCRPSPAHHTLAPHALRTRAQRSLRPTSGRLAMLRRPRSWWTTTAGGHGASGG